MMMIMIMKKMIYLRVAMMLHNKKDFNNLPILNRLVINLGLIRLNKHRVLWEIHN
jgi:hypothetical protein